VCFGCVVRVELIVQEPTMSLFGASLAEGVLPRHPLRELPMAGICERWTGELVIPGAGAVVARGVGDPLFEKISCPVPLRTGMS
jgi:hypothetical protein